MKLFIRNMFKKIIKSLVVIFPLRKSAIIHAAEYAIIEAKNIERKTKIGRSGKKELRDRPSIEDLCMELAQYDIISFDIFDTLIFRAFPDPKVIFDLWGEHFKIQYGRKIRSDAEREAREEIIDREITLKEIYEKVYIKSGIDIEEGMQKEIDLEIYYCQPNPYMIELFNKLRKMCKTIIITSDMYLPRNVIERMLQKCGYTNWNDLYVSSEYGKTKANGDLYSYIIEIYGKNKSYIHIGDNQVSDIKNAEKAGWSTYYYESIHKRGKAFRPGNMSSIGGGLYRGVVNTFLYNGLSQIEPYYDLGFVHFGIFVYGYCCWLNRIAKETGADLIVFAARDMYIIEKVYKEYFNLLPSEYVYVSRLAVLRADFDKSTEMFLTCLRDSYEHSSDISINEYFIKIGFSFIFPLLEKYQLEGTEKIIDTYEILRKLIYENKKYILLNLEKDHQAGISYYKKMYKNNGCPKKLLFADMNGRCTSTLGIQHLLDEAGCETQVIGTQMYSISDKGFVEIKISKNSLKTFLFSYLKNRNFYDEFRKKGIMRTRSIEAVFTEARGTLQSYAGIDGEMQFADGSMADDEKLKKIHQGIMDFARIYHYWLSEADKDIVVTPFDAWMPVEQIIDSLSSKYPDLLSDMTLGG